MKGFRFPDFGKGAALSALACVLVSATALSLSSCGDGGALDEDTILLKRSFEEKYVFISASNAPNVLVEVHNTNGQKTRTFYTTVHWGNGQGSLTSSGLFIIDKFTKDEATGKLTSFDFSLSTNAASLLDCNAFRDFWGIRREVAGLTVTGMKHSVTGYNQMLGDTSFGHYEATCEWAGNEPAGTKPPVEGTGAASGTVFVSSDYPQNF